MGKIKILKRVVLLLFLVVCYACGDNDDNEVTSTSPSSVALGQVSVSLNTETDIVTIQIEMTSLVTDGAEIKLHSSYLNYLNGSENCGDVIATATVSSDWVTFSFENPAITYAVEDGFRDRFWGTIWFTSSETCDSPDEWIDFWNVELNPYYFEDCDGNGEIEMVFYTNRVEAVSADAACGEVYEEPEPEPEEPPEEPYDGPPGPMANFQYLLILKLT